ncbi:MAG: O-antigen ligase family protein [Nocardiaceae bacterium]|nr:O-antigen ligase family protein [Nocardiaceae bacterium]
MGTSALLGVLAVFEAVIRRDFYYDALFQAVARTPIQRWSEYRSMLSFGHPLMAGTFFAVGSAYAFGKWMDTRQRANAVFGVASAAGAVATLSRGAVAALGIAIVVSVFSVLFRRGHRTLSASLTAGIVGVPIVWTVLTLFANRASSDEALASTAYRANLQRLSLQAIEKAPMTGYGPGALDEVSRQLGLWSGGNFENSVIDLALALGIPFVALWYGTLVVGAIVSLLNGRRASLAAITAYLVSSTTFNLLLGWPTFLFLAGYLLYGCCDARSKVTDESVNSRARRNATPAV